MSKISSNKSKYSKSKKLDMPKDFDDEFDEDDQELDGNGEGQDFDENNDSGEFDENQNGDDFDENSEVPKSHLRSNGLFENTWWKKGLLKGFIIFLIAVVFFYFFDFVGLINVENWKRWFFFLVVLLIFGLVYEKFKLNRFIQI